MVTPLPWLERVPTFKDQQEQLKDKDLNTYGFLGYPLLQTADIIIYRANFVPVGEDQASHLELSREIVRRFNNFYGDVFPEPQPLFTATPKVPGLDGRKMSKSYGNTIGLTASADEIRALVMTMFTDPNRVRRKDPGQSRHLQSLPVPQALLRRRDDRARRSRVPHGADRLRRRQEAAGGDHDRVRCGRSASGARRSTAIRRSSGTSCATATARRASAPARRWSWCARR